MSDYMIRATAAGEFVRAFAITSGELVETARQKHDCSPVVTAALGRTLSAGLMMGSMMKDEDDLLTLQLLGDGPCGGITVTADCMGHAKGFAANPQVDISPRADGKLDVGGAVGSGFLRVMKDIGLKEPYVGTVALRSGEVAEDLTYYFAVSEQTPSSVALGVLVDRDCSVKCAGGFIIQLMPGASDEVIDALEANLSSLPPVTAMLSDGHSPEEMLERVLAGMDLHITDRMEVSFRCDCSRERIEKTLSSLPDADLDEMINDGEVVEVKCHFCNGAYVFTPQEIAQIREARKGV